MLTSEQTDKSPNLVLFPRVGTILSEDTCDIDTMSELGVSLEAITIAEHVSLTAYNC